MKQIQWLASSIGYIALGVLAIYVSLFLVAVIAAVAIPMLVLTSYASFIAIAAFIVAFVGYRIIRLILD